MRLRAMADGSGGTDPGAARDGASSAERRTADDRAEGGSGAARGESDPTRVVVDRDAPVGRWRWRCPEGHCDWEPTNGHVWCATCAATSGVDPEHWELLDAKTGELVNWAAVELR